MDTDGKLETQRMYERGIEQLKEDRQLQMVTDAACRLAQMELRKIRRMAADLKIAVNQ